MSSQRVGVIIFSISKSLKYHGKNVEEKGMVWIRTQWLKLKVINENILTNGAESNTNELCYIIIYSGNLWRPEAWQHDIKGSMCKLQYYCSDSIFLERNIVITEPIISICNNAPSKCLHVHTEAYLKGQGTKPQFRKRKPLNISMWYEAQSRVLALWEAEELYICWQSMQCEKGKQNKNIVFFFKIKTSHNTHRNILSLYSNSQLQHKKDSWFL